MCFDRSFSAVALIIVALTKRLRSARCYRAAGMPKNTVLVLNIAHRRA